MKDIIVRIGEAAILEQLAEECAELGKATLKLSRIVRDENPTPVKGQEAFNEMVEEIGDVRLLLHVLDTMYGGIPTQEIEDSKLKRWKSRIEIRDSETRERKVKECKNYAIVVCETKSQIESLKLAVKKIEPMEIEKVFQDEYYCPRCGNENVCSNGVVLHKYCPDCGQRIIQKEVTENE